MAIRDNNRWIVSAHAFFEHHTPDEAEAERLRLSVKHPEKTFRLYRIKHYVIPPRELTDQEDT